MTVLSELQQSRIEALDASRKVLLGAPSFGEALAGSRNVGTSLLGQTSDLLTVANYIVTGEHFLTGGLSFGQGRVEFVLDDGEKEDSAEDGFQNEQPTELKTEGDQGDTEVV